MHTFFKTIRNNNLLMAGAIILFYFLMFKVLTFIVKIVRYEKYTNNNSSFLNKQKERMEKFKNRNNTKLGHSTLNTKKNSSK
jgi:hypothetical protein